MRARTKIGIFALGCGLAIVIGYLLIALEVFPSNQLESTLRKAIADKRGGTLNIQEVTPFKWDRLDIYLNHFLVNTTQRVLDWLISTKISTNIPVSYSLYDSMWLPIIPDPEQRQIIINVLKNHYLVSTDNGLITVTPKGIEYAEWRGELS